MLELSLEGITLQVTDVDHSLEFYRKLPSAIVVVHRPREFALIQIGKGRLGLLSKQLGGPTHIEMETIDLDGLHQKLEDLGITTQGPPSAKPWDSVRDFLLIDPDGYIIEFSEMHGTNAAE